MRVLVTGGGGFLGAAAVRALVARGDTAIAFDTQLAHLANEGPLERLIGVPGNITDMANIAQAVSVHKPESIVHCAAIVGVRLLRRGALHLSRAWVVHAGVRPR